MLRFRVKYAPSNLGERRPYGVECEDCGGWVESDRVCGPLGVAEVVELFECLTEAKESNEQGGGRDNRNAG